METILIVDDELSVRRGLKMLLEEEGYAVALARNGDEAMEFLAASRPDLVLLDVMMPKRNGYAVCREIRQKDKTLPILFLSSLQTDVDQLRGFGVGADDYVFKTVAPAVLLARIRRALGRTVDRWQAATLSRVVAIGEALVDFDGLTVTGGGVKTRLTKTEADFLWILQTERGKVFGYDEILEILKGRGYLGSEGTLYVHMSRLKRKLGRIGNLIQNERGVGYWLLP